MDSGANHLGDSVFFQDVLPLHWRLLEQAPTSSACAQCAAVNDHLLQLLDTWEDGRSEKDESEYVPEWRKIDAKLTILLDWVGQLLRLDQTLPAPVQVKMHSQTIYWQTVAPPADAGWVQLEVYLHQIPQALRFFGRARQAPSPWTGCVALECGVPEAYEKFLFRQHRRAVAMQRSQT